MISELERRRPVEIVRGVFQVPMGPFGQVANGYIWISEEGPVVIDTGTPRDSRTMIDALTALGFAPQEVVALLLTHGDIDHVGGLAALKRWCHAPVVVGAPDVPLVEGRICHDTRIRRNTLTGQLFVLLYAKLQAIVGVAEPVVVDIALTPASEETPGGLRPIPTPGHTAGHISYFAPQDGILFTGDAILNLGRLSTPLSAFTENMDQARRSVRKLATLNFSVACFGHGPPITRHAGRKVRRFAESKKIAQ